MKHKSHALKLIRQRLETAHSNLPNSRELSEKLDDLLPMLQVFEAPKNYIDPQAKASDFETAKELYLRTNHFLADLKDGQQSNVTNVLSQLLSGVVQDTDSYLQKHHQDAQEA